MREVPDEVAHDRAHDQAGHQLEESEDVEGDAGVVGGSGLRSALEWAKHCLRKSPGYWMGGDGRSG